MFMTVQLETCPGVEMTKSYMTLPLLCYSCPGRVFLCFIQQSLHKVTAEEQLMGVTETGQKRQQEPSRNSTHPSTISPRKKKTSLSVLEKQENTILPGKSGFCDGIQVWLFHFHFTFQRKQKLGQTTATGFISLATSVKVSQDCLHFTEIIKPDRIL